MTGSGELRIVVRYSRLADKWLASLEDEPLVVFDGELFGRDGRLLAGLAAAPGRYKMRWIQPHELEDDGSWTADWNPPELLYECPECDGKGQRADGTDAVPCGKCDGRGVLCC